MYLLNFSKEWNIKKRWKNTHPVAIVSCVSLSSLTAAWINLAPEHWHLNCRQFLISLTSNSNSQTTNTRKLEAFKYRASDSWGIVTTNLTLTKVSRVTLGWIIGRCFKITTVKQNKLKRAKVVISNSLNVQCYSNRTNIISIDFKIL